MKDHIMAGMSIENILSVDYDRYYEWLNSELCGEQPFIAHWKLKYFKN